MCYNAKSSLIAFLVTSICSIYIYHRDYKYGKALALFFFTVSLMQISEFFMWSDQGCGNMNHYATLFAFIVLCLEPLIAIWVAYKFDITNIDKKKLKYILYIYVIVFGFAIIKSLLYSGKLCSKPNPNNANLNWGIHPIVKTLPKFILYIFYVLYFGAFLTFLLFKNKKEGLTYFLLYMGTLVISKLITLGNPGAWKSIWCIYVNIIPILAIFIGEYYKS